MDELSGTFLLSERMKKVNDRLDQLVTLQKFNLQELEVLSTRIHQLNENSLLLLTSTATFCSSSSDYTMLDSQLELLIGGSVERFNDFANEARATLERRGDVEPDDS